jgi:hypothetical protein
VSAVAPAPLTDTWRVAEIHYFRVPRERWELMVLRARQSGANAVSTYIPWIHHEPSNGVLDLTGTTLAERDLVGFVDVCAAAGLGFIAKPGPFVDSEMLGGGVPTWLIEAHPEWWAIRHDGEPYRHGDSDDPRLSYDAPGYQQRAAVWLRAVAVALRPFVGSALWAWQIDNEAPGDGMLVHESSEAPSPLRADFADSARWQSWLERQHGHIELVNERWNTSFRSFVEIDLPRRWDAPGTPAAALRWIDLDHFADHQIASGLGAWAAVVRQELGDEVPLFHDWLCMPWPLAGMLIEPGAMADTCGWVGQNVYAEDVDPASMIAGTQWYRMNTEEYVHHAWWRTRLCHTLSPPGLPHLVPEISARQAFYLQCCLVGGMDAPCIYMLHSSDPEPAGIGAFQRWAEEAPVLPDGSIFPWWWNMRTLFLVLQAGGHDLATSPLSASVAIAYDHAGERLARFNGMIEGGGLVAGEELSNLAASANTSAAGLAVARELVDAGIEFDVVDVTRSSLDPYELVVVPATSVMSRLAQHRLAERAESVPGSVRRAGPAPTHDENLHAFAVLEGLPSFTPPTAHQRGVDVGVRVGASGRRYVTIVNRHREHWRGSVDVAGCGGVTASIGGASVSWAALESTGDQVRVVAALLHGHDASVGELCSSNGQAAIVRLGDAWHVVHSESCRVIVPEAAGLALWRVTLSGNVLECGVVAADGHVELVALDDAGQTDRYVLGERAAADEVADPVRHYQLSTLAAVGEMCDAVGVPPGEVTHRLRRIRSSVAAGSATDDQRALLEPLARIAVRMNDLRLGES